MADIPDDLPLKGGFAIARETCIDCFLCQDLTPSNFARDKENGVHYVCKQPENAKELHQVVDALESCPTNSIHHLPILTEEASESDVHR